jgi:pyruvate dehydrogenase E2 component (dihydrolipoamide acetyltransferase)
MAEFRMPALGADMEAGTLVEWKVKPGDRVKRGDLIASVETVKGVIEVEVFEDGVVEALLVEVGQTVPVNTPLARITAAPSPREERAGERGVVRASPVAKRMAADLGVDLTRLHGSGPGGAVLKADVEAAAPKPAEGKAPAAAPRFEAGQMRRAIAAAMARSKQDIPHYYLATEIDLARSLAWMQAENVNRSVADRLLPAALLLKAAALAVSEVPEANGTFTGGRFVASKEVHLGVAIALKGGGLVAPGLRDAASLSLTALMQALTDLVTRARSGRLRASEMGEQTLTVTNLGEVGVTSAFPIIVPPQVAMVGFGKVQTRPWVVDGGAVGPRPIVVASLAADHRVSDGLRGARYLSTLDELLQHPEAL